MLRMSDFPLAIALVLAVVVPLALARAYAKVTDELLAEWAHAHDVELTTENRPMVARYLHRARVLRTWGVLGGLFLPSLVELVVSGRPAAPARAAGRAPQRRPPVRRPSLGCRRQSRRGAHRGARGFRHQLVARRRGR
jgi:hypothetical protein